MKEKLQRAIEERNMAVLLAVLHIRRRARGKDLSPVKAIPLTLEAGVLHCFLGYLAFFKGLLKK